MTQFFSSKNAPDYFQHEDERDTPAAVIEPHFVDIGDRVLFVVQSCNMVLGALQDTETGDELTTLRMDSRMGPGALVYVMSAQELRVMAQAFVERANKVEGDAAEKAREALDRALKGGK